MEKTMDNCIFCKIAKGEIPSNTIYEDETFKVILDMNQKHKGHMLILPKEHWANLYEMPDEQLKGAIVLAKKLAVSAKGVLSADGMNLLQNNGECAGQSVMHFHLHLLPRSIGDGDSFPAWDEGGIGEAESKELAEQLTEKLVHVLADELAQKLSEETNE